MTDTDALPKLKTAERYVQLETDTFCVECGYNLHSQPVTRDERLGIFVCRCPECGRFHPAGTGMTASKPWLNRFAAGLLVFWVLFVLHAVFWVIMGMGAISVLHIETYVYRTVVSTDGAPAVWLNNATGGYQVVLKATSQPITNWTYAYTLDASEAINSPWGRRYQQPWWVNLIIVGFAAGIGLVTGVLLVVFLWHWKRRGYRWALVLPFAVASGLCVVFWVNEEYHPILPWAVRVTLGYACIQAAFMALGINIGRPIARGLLRMFVPPRPRQHFAFLWRVDGKNPPAASPHPAPAMAHSS